MSYFALGYEGRSAAKIRKTKKTTRYKDSNEREYVFALPHLAKSVALECPTPNAVCMEVALPNTYTNEFEPEIWFPVPDETIRINIIAPEYDPKKASLPPIIDLRIVSIDYRHGRTSATLIGIVSTYSNLSTRN